MAQPDSFSRAADNPARNAEELCVAQRRAWKRGRRTKAEDYLREFSWLKHDSEAVLDLIYNEIVLREESEEVVTFEEYQQRFPHLDDDLKRLFEVHRAIDDEADLADEGTARNYQNDTPVLHSRTTGPSLERHRRIGGYEILEEIGRGGMGIVYRARQPGTNRIVALKVVLAGRFASDEEMARFRAEAESAARLDHPSIVPVFEVGQDGDLCYFSMACVNGQTLADVFQRGAISPAVAARLVCQIAEAVDYAHSRGVIHRDLKPHNILLPQTAKELDSPDSSDPHAIGDGPAEMQPRITDFGLAKQCDTIDSLTITGQVLGTPHYMAPEQALANHDRAEPATDVYALGAILYEALTGRPPFEAATAVDILWQVVNQEAASPRVRNRAIDADLETICLKCLEKDPLRRYRSASALADDLNRYLAGQTISARPVSQLSRWWRWCRRHPLVTTMAATIAMLVVALATGSSIAALRLSEKNRETLNNLQRAQNAELLSKQRLFDSYLNQARFGRRTGRPGQRLDTLRAIESAVALCHELDLPAECLQALRNEAVAALSLIDVKPNPRNPIVLEGNSNVAFDDALTQFAVPASDGSVSIYDFDTRRVISHLAGSGKPVASLKFVPKSESLAAISGADLVVWEVDGKPAESSLLAGGVAAFDFAPDGEQMVVTYLDDTLRIWDLNTKQASPAFEAGTAEGCRVHPDGQRAAVWSNSEVRLVDLQNGKTVERFSHSSGGRVQSLAWSSDGRLLATGTSDHAAYVWDANCLSGPQFKLEGHEAWVRHVEFSRDGNLLLTASPVDEQTRIWNPWTGRLLIRFEGCGLQFGRDDKTIAGIDHRNVSDWTISRNDILRSFRSSDLSYTTGRAEISPDGRWLVSGDWDGIRLWHFANGTELQFKARSNVGLAFAPDSRSLVTSEGSGLWSWPLDSTQRDLRLAKPQRVSSAEEINCARNLAFTSDGRELITLNIDLDCARLVSLDSPDRPPRVISRPGLERAAVSANGKWIVSSAKNEPGLVVWDHEGQQVRQLLTHESDVTCGFSPDGKWLVGGGEREYFFWHVGSWELSHSLKLPQAAATSRRLAFSRNGRLMAVAHDRQQIHLVNPQLGRILWTLPTDHFDTWLCFSPKGNHLACMDARMGIQVWDLQKLRQQLSSLNLAPVNH